MQKLTYINPLGEELKFNTDEIGITEWNGFSNVGSQIQSQQVPFVDGTVFLDFLFNNRTLNITIAINDENDLTKRYEIKRKIISLLNPKLGEGTLIYTNDFLSKKITVIPDLPIFKNKNSNQKGTLKGTLTFTACNPYWNNLTPETTKINDSNITSIINDGDVDSEVKMTLFPNNNKFIRVVNKTNSSELSLNGYFNLPIDINLKTGEKNCVLDNIEYSNSKPTLTKVIEFNSMLYGFDDSKILWVSEDGKNFKFFKKLQEFIRDIFVFKDYFLILFQDYLIYSADINSDIDDWEVKNFTVRNLFYLDKTEDSEDSEELLIYGMNPNDKIIIISNNLIDFDELTTSNQLNLSVRPPKAFKFEIDDEEFVASFIDINNRLIGLTSSFSEVVIFSDSAVKDFTYCPKLNKFLITATTPYYSEDGINWEEGNYTWWAGADQKIIKYRSLIYVFYINTPYYSFTSDGINWGKTNFSVSNNKSQIIFNNDLFCYGSNKNYSFIEGYFNEKISFTLQNNKICESTDGTFFAIGGTKLYKSKDLINWETVNSSIPSTTYFLKFMNNILFIGSSNSKLYFSEDYGENFESVTIDSQNNAVNALDYYENKYYVGVGNTLYVSTDLVSFSFMQNLGSFSILEIKKIENTNLVYMTTSSGSGSRLFAINETDLSRKIDLLLLNQSSTSSKIFVDYDKDRAVIFIGNSIFIKINVSSDYYLTPVKIDFTCSNVFGDSDFLIAENSGSLYYSNDGSNWFEIFNYVSSNFYFSEKLKTGIFFTNEYVFEFIFDKNIIEYLTKINFKLSVGNNDILIIVGENECAGIIEYNNRYLGV